MSETPPISRCCLPTILIAWLLCITACTVGPDYRQPDTNMPEKFAETIQTEYRPGTVEIAWWKQFGDARLEKLVEQAVRGNRDLRAAEARLREARALLLDAGLELLPTVTTHANYTTQKRSLDALNRRNFVPRDLRLYNVGFDAVWEADFFGRLRRNLEAKQAELEVSAADRRDLLVTLISEIARNYFLLRGHQNQLAVARNNAENQGSTLRFTQARLEGGVGTELDTARALSLLSTVQATIPPLQALVHEDIHRISVLTGKPPVALMGELGKPEALPRLPSSLKIGKPGDLLRRRPDIRAAERSLAAATASIGVITADLFPRVTFQGTIALESVGFVSLGTAGSETFNAGPRIFWAAFDLAQVRARIRSADARAETRLAEYEQTVLEALEETENALVTYHQQRARSVLLTGAEQAAAAALALARIRYEEGISDFLTVLDAERSLLENRRQLAENQTAEATALVALFKALGGGWEVFEPKG